MKTKVLFLILSAAFLAGCNKIEQTEPISPLAEEVPGKYDVTQEAALNVASMFKGPDTKVDALSPEKVVSSNFTLKDEENKNYLHIVNYEDGGFVL
jgi:hypothetical protein